MNQLTVLSAVTRLADGERPRQKDVVHATALTKGAVSNNCAKLVDDGLLRLTDGRYAVDEERLLDLYRTHLEDHLRRRRLPDEYRRYNDIRTATKRRMRETMEGETGDLLTEILVEVVAGAPDDGQLNTLQDVFHRADQVVTALAESAYASEETPGRTDLMLLAVSMDHAPEYAERDDYDLTKRAVHGMAKELTEDILNA